MCGINVAVALGTTTLGGFGSRAFAAMHFANQLRGVDAAGIFCRKGDEVTYYKDAGAASAQRRSSEYTGLLSSARFAVGHTRAATLGYRTYFKEAEDPVNDSDAFYQAIAAVEPDKAVDVLGRIYSGAFALVWYDMRVNELRIARNDERPFWMTEYTTAGGSFLLGASQPGYIAMAVAHATDKPEEYLNVKAWELLEGKMLAINFKSGETTITDFDLPTYPAASVWTPPPYKGKSPWDRSSYYTPYYERYGGYSQASPYYGDENAKSYDVYEGGKKRTVVYDHVTKTWSDKEED
jgi:hypothetical protein